MGLCSTRNFSTEVGATQGAVQYWVLYVLCIHTYGRQLLCSVMEGRQEPNFLHDDTRLTRAWSAN